MAFTAMFSTPAATLHSAVMHMKGEVTGGWRDPVANRFLDCAVAPLGGVVGEMQDMEDAVQAEIAKIEHMLEEAHPKGS
jgi:hypothetical protein